MIILIFLQIVEVMQDNKYMYVFIYMCNTYTFMLYFEVKNKYLGK